MLPGKTFPWHPDIWHLKDGPIWTNVAGQMLPGQMSLWQLTSVEDGYIEHELELELSLAKCSPIKLQG